MSHPNNTNARGDGGGKFSQVNTAFDKVLKPLGMTAHPFQMGWYNDLVGPHFVLDYSPRTVAYVIISGPDLFERCVLPYLKEASFKTDNPLDDAVVNALNLVKNELASLKYSVDVFFDFDLHPSRKPKVLVQTAAHVAGTVQYFHKSRLPMNIQEQVFSQESQLSGVAVHPEYGGWFAIRAVIIFKNLQVNEDDKESLPRPPLLNLIPEEKDVIKLIKEFAYNWEEVQWRNIYKGSGAEYSQGFKDFLCTKAEERWNFLKENGFLDG